MLNVTFTWKIATFGLTYKIYEHVGLKMQYLADGMTFGEQFQNLVQISLPFGLIMHLVDRSTKHKLFQTPKGQMVQRIR